MEIMENFKRAGARPKTKFLFFQISHKEFTSIETDAGYGRREEILLWEMD